MLTDLKVSSVACQWVFYKPEYNAKRTELATDFFKILECKNEVYQQLVLEE